MIRNRFSFRPLFSMDKTTMKKIAWKLVLVIPTLFLLVSCSNKKVVDLHLKYVPVDRVPAQITDEQAQAQVAEAATAVGRSLQELSAVRMTTHPPQKLSAPFNPQVIGMGKVASVSWTGPVEPILKQIAQATHYQLRVIGKEPSLPVLVSLDIHNQPIANILRNITYQVVMKANIALYPKSHTIELRYHDD